MPAVFETDYRLRWMDFDAEGRIQPAALLDIFQDTATLHANEIGLGRKEMTERGVFWVITRIKYEVAKDPVHHQKVIARTWPHTPSKFSFMRDFTIRDAETGEELIKGTSEWMLLDIETRSIVSASDVYSGFELLEDRNFAKKPRKIKDFEAAEPAATFTPAYTDIDLNGHVNNSRYPNFALNALEPGEAGSIASFQIDFRHEVMPHEPLKLFTIVEDGAARVKGVRPDGETAFMCAIEAQ